MIKKIAFSLFLLLLLISCSGEQKSKSTKQDQGIEVKEKTSSKEAAVDDCKDVHWTYEGDHGPDHWKDLCSGFAACGGKKQSPVDIITAEAVSDKNLKAPEFHYGETTADIVNNGHTIQFNISGDHKVNLEGKDYQLLQFHYHHLSEHTIDGKHYPLEVHFVHKHNDKDFAVLGIVFVEGKENELFKRFLDKFPKEKGNWKSEDKINLIKLFPPDLSYYRYNGSLTTPPCSEVVNWYVLKQPVEASKEQIEKFANILHNNYRPVQPLNGRKVSYFQGG